MNEIAQIIIQIDKDGNKRLICQDQNYNNIIVKENNELIENEVLKINDLLLVINEPNN